MVRPSLRREIAASAVVPALRENADALAPLMRCVFLRRPLPLGRVAGLVAITVPIGAIDLAEARAISSLRVA